MAKLLYVEASPRKERSASIEVCRAFLEAYRAAHCDDQIETLDVWALELPTFDNHALTAKYAGLGGITLTAQQARAWDGIRRLAAPFLAADKLLFAVPMWNFSIPYRLKHLIDLISQKDVLFSFGANGFGGLMKARKAAVVYARGLDYFSESSATPATGYDLQKPYMETWLRFIGVTEVFAVVIEKTLLGPDIDAQSRAEAKRKAEALARLF
jgi:FMN-dependent NADH-azoreductase